MKQKEQNHRSLLRCVTLAVLLLVVMWVSPTLTVRAHDLSGITDEAEERGLDLNGRRYFIDFSPHGSDKSSFLLNLDAHCEITIRFWSNYYSGSGTAGLEIRTQNDEVWYSKTGIEKGTLFIPLDFKAGTYRLDVFMEKEDADSRVTLELYRDVDVIEGRVRASELRHTKEGKKLYIKGSTELVLDKDLTCKEIESLVHISDRHKVTLTGEGTLIITNAQRGCGNIVITGGTLNVPAIDDLIVKGGVVNINNNSSEGCAISYSEMLAGTLNITTTANGIGNDFKIYGGKLIVDARGFGVRASIYGHETPAGNLDFRGFPGFYGGEAVIRGGEGVAYVDKVIGRGEESGDNLGMWDEYIEASVYISPDMRIVSPEAGYSKTGKGDYVFSADVKELVLSGPAAGAWRDNNRGAWYEYPDGTYPKNCWKKIEGTWYYFKESGYIHTGWLKNKSSWYYLSSSGAMKTGWLKEKGKWYYLASSGAMKTGWLKEKGKWYYLETSGAMKTGWLQDNGKWYYLEASGAMVSGTSKKINGKVYYFGASGVCMNP